MAGSRNGPNDGTVEGSLENTPMSVNLGSRVLTRLITGLQRAVLPTRCLLCGDPGQEDDLCAACRADLPWNAPACEHCALPLPQPGSCGACLRQPPPYARALAVWRYAGAVAQLVPRFKFHHDLAAGRLLAELAQARLEQWPGWQGVDQVVPMPLHAARLGRRGYNQALELARPWAGARRLPLSINMLRRTRATVPQTELDAAARRRNVRGAFAAAACTGAIVLLVDDVMTTGASLGEAARTLLRAGAAEVRVLVAARAPEPGQGG